MRVRIKQRSPVLKQYGFMVCSVNAGFNFAADCHTNKILIIHASRMGV